VACATSRRSIDSGPLARPRSQQGLAAARNEGLPRHGLQRDYDWNWPKKIERDLIERALTLEFIREGRNLVLLGTNGLGKTMLVKNIAHQAVLAGFSALLTTVAELIEDLRSRSRSPSRSM
jgi:DNA replication protein DnaC